MKILILANDAGGLYNFRKELIQKLVQDDHTVYAALPTNDASSRIASLGCEVVDTPVSRHGTNPAEDFRLLRQYKSILKSVQPDIVFTYTIKPNIYGGMACAQLGIPYVVNITGLGEAVENPGLVQKITLMLYRIALKNVQTVFFQNAENEAFFTQKKLAVGKHKMLPGSGVNLEQYCMEEYPTETDGIRLLYVARITKDKGIEELLACAQKIHSEYPNVKFDIVGAYDDEKYRTIIEQMSSDGVIQYHGLQRNIHNWMKNCHAVIHPTYHEGMSNVLLEASATGRPVLASSIPGCREIFEEGISGLGFLPKNTDEMVSVVRKFLALSPDERAKMGAEARKKVEREFDRNFVVAAYIKEIKEGS